MPRTLFNAAEQIQTGTISWALMASGAIVPTASLVDGANFVKRDGTVAMTAGLNLGGFEITNIAAPTTASSATPRSYVDAAINGLAIRRARFVFTTNVTLSGIQNADSVTAVAGDRTFLTGQTTASQNGPWQQAAGAWTRPSDWAAASTQKSTMVFIEEGTVFHDTKWIIATDAITVDTTAITATQDQSGTTYVAGTGLGLAGSTFSVTYGTGAGTAAQGNDTRITGALQTTALGTGVQTALGIAVGSAGAPVVLGGALGTPASGTLTNATGLPATGLTGTLAAAQFPALTGDVTTVAGALAATINTTAGSGFLKYTSFVFNETPGGTINGVNTTFTLANTPANGFGGASSLSLFYGGILLKAGAGNDFTLSGSTITMLTAPSNSANGNFTAEYVK